MLTKQIIREFIDKCRAKALAAVKKEGSLNYEASIDKFLSEIKFRRCVFDSYNNPSSIFATAMQEWNDKEKAVAQEYSGLQAYVTRHTPKQSVEELKRLGFDTAWIDKAAENYVPVPSKELNPSNLLVCDGAGVDE